MRTARPIFLLELTAGALALAPGAPAATRCVGGGPVLTIGRFGAFREPSVVIDRVTITGGRTSSSWLSDLLIGTPGVAAKGAGSRFRRRRTSSRAPRCWCATA
jgi:hypothetical protein